VRAPARAIAIVLIQKIDVISALTTPLAAAVADAIALYGRMTRPPELTRYFLGAKVPRDLRSPDLDWSRISHTLDREEWWEALRVPGQRLLDQASLTAKVRELLDLPRSTRSVVITDHEIVPPDDWRYILWDEVSGHDFVISFRPMDPHYWSSESKVPERIKTIKPRVRAALIATIGGLVGMTSCHVPSCFLFKGVEAVSQLDSMETIGAEHDVPELAGLTFLDEVNPDLPARIAPRPGGEK
jgi:hypothetical protein